MVTFWVRLSVKCAFEVSQLIRAKLATLKQTQNDHLIFMLKKKVKN